jgi:uncharacterized membrane protein YczE
MRASLRFGHLVTSCVVLGVGIAMLLLAALGSDGYSTLVNGASIALDVPFFIINAILGVLLVALAWWRGLVPGVGTVVQPVVVGATVSLGLAVFDGPDAIGARAVLLVLAFPVLAVGIAGYLSSGTGAGPAEAAALAFDPPVPFRWSYSVLQGGGALVGWQLGASIGPGTLLAIFLLGPSVDLLSARVRFFDISVAGRDAGTPRQPAD